jgi:hypothetical protein
MSAMSTPVNSIPLKTSQNINQDDDSNDPLVQDVLNEFKREIKTNQPPPQQPHEISYQPPHIIHNANHVPPVNLDVYNPHQTSYLNIEILKKSIYLTIIACILFYPGLFSKIVSSIIPESFIAILMQYEFFVITSIVLVSFYVTHYYKVL